MQTHSASKIAAGVIAWLLVGALALVATEYWDALWGAIPVLVAVVVMWLLGERMIHPEKSDAEKGAGNGS